MSAGTGSVTVTTGTESSKRRPASVTHALLLASFVADGLSRWNRPRRVRVGIDQTFEQRLDCRVNLQPLLRLAAEQLALELLKLTRQLVDLQRQRRTTRFELTNCGLVLCCRKLVHAVKCY